MLIDTQLPLLDIEGKPVKEEETVITLGTIMVRALTNPVIDEQGKPKAISNDEKLKLWLLASKIQTAVLPVELTVDEASKIKTRAGEMWAAVPMIYARLHEAIEAAAKGSKE